MLQVNNASKSPLAVGSQGVGEVQQRSANGTTAGLAPTLSDAHFKALLKRGFTETHVDWMAREGYVRSVSWEEMRDGSAPDGRRWIELFPLTKQTQTGALMLAFDPRSPFPTYSARCDVPPVKRENPLDPDEVCKYLYASSDREWSPEEIEANPDRRLRPFIPNEVMGPTGGSLGNALIATEGLLDAMVCTLLLGVPCVGVTAPSHLGQAELPHGCGLWINDCDLSMARSLLQQVLDHVRRRSMKCARLPFRAAYLDDYLNRPHDLPNEAKGGMEELLDEHGGDAAAAREALREVIRTAAQPADFLRREFGELAKLGIKWGQGHNVCLHLIEAIASAAPGNVAVQAQLAATLKEAITVPVGVTTTRVKDHLQAWRREGHDTREWHDPGPRGHTLPFAKEPEPGGDGDGEGEAIRFGHIAFRELYGGGVDYRTIGSRTYRFNGVHYELQTKERMRVEAMEFALSYPVADAKGRITHPFATADCANQAIAVLQMSTARHPSEVNPSGYVNCTNCVVRITWTGPGRLQMALEELPHSRDLIFVDEPGCRYDPEADPSDYNRMMECLDPGPRQMLMQVLGSALDVPRVGERIGRIPMVFFAGDGLNGKDNVTQKTRRVLGESAVTGVTLAQFAQFDKGEGAGRFAVAQLAFSRLNISGENTKACKLENLESIKLVASRDPMVVEEKGGHPFTITPSAVCFFNFNALPNMDAVRAATTSRFVILSFDKTYSLNPDHRKGELQADVRFKEDPEWVKENVLPAFLNAMLKGLQFTIQQGSIDCSSGNDAMQEARENSTHLWQMVREIGLEEGEPWEEVRPRDVWARMLEWYVASEYADWADGGLYNGPDGNRPFRWRNGVLDGDRPIQRSNEVVTMLRKRMFPRMRTRTAGGGVKLIQGFKLRNSVPHGAEG